MHVCASGGFRGGPSSSLFAKYLQSNISKTQDFRLKVHQFLAIFEGCPPLPCFFEISGSTNVCYSCDITTRILVSWNNESTKKRKLEGGYRLIHVLIDSVTLNTTEIRMWNVADVGIACCIT
jgi:hypothetical protein